MQDRKIFLRESVNGLPEQITRLIYGAGVSLSIRLLGNLPLDK